MTIGLFKVEQVHSHKWTWTTVGHRWGYKSAAAGDVFCLYRRDWTEKGEEEKKGVVAKNFNVQLVISGPRLGGRQAIGRRET